MFLWITRNPDAEIGRRWQFYIMVKINPIVHLFDLMNQIRGVGVSVFFWFEISFGLHHITTKSHHIIYPQEVQVYQEILRFLSIKASTQDMRNSIYMISVLYRRTDTHCSWAFSYHFSFQQAIFMLYIFVLFSVISHIDKTRIILQKRVYSIKEQIDILSFKRRQNLKRKKSLAIGFFYVFCYFHDCLFCCLFLFLNLYATPKATKLSDSDLKTENPAMVSNCKSLVNKYFSPADKLCFGLAAPNVP